MKAKTHRLVWLVEMLNDAHDPPRWEPPVGTSLSRKEGRLRLRLWQQANVSDRFRLVKYAAVSHG